MFSYQQRPGKTDILFDGDPILTFIAEHVYFGKFEMLNLKLRPHGPVEMISLVPSAFYGFKLQRCDIRCEVEDAHSITVTMTPAFVQGNLTDYVWEERRIHIDYLPTEQRFRYTFTVQLDFRKDITRDDPLAFTGMPGWGDFAVIEFDDPLLAGGVGPQVPMTQDWVGMPEPWLAEDCYTTTWKKRYLSVTLPTVERGLRKLVFNRIVNGVQQFFNRTLVKTAPRQPYLYEKADGNYLRYTPLFDAIGSHHICEWGFDMHWYAQLPRAGQYLFTAGQQVTLAYQFEEITRAEVPAAYLTAPLAEIEPEECLLADRPIYQEPVTLFDQSALDHPDAYAWEPMTEHCQWNRTGGREAGHGALEIHHGEQPADSSWIFQHLGPSYACNPVPPHSRFRVSAWVKATELDKVQLSLTFNAYQGPALYAPRVPQTCTGGAQQLQRREGDFALISFETPPYGIYILSGIVTFQYTGKGEVSLTDLQVERLTESVARIAESV